MIFMSTLITPAVGTYTARSVAQCVGLDVAALRLLGVPEGDELTRDDLSALLAELKRRGYPTKALSLEVFMRQQSATPSRGLITSPVSKSADAPWFRKGTYA